MTYARIENEQVVEYPIYEGDIRLRFSNVSFPENFEPPEGYVRVIDIVQPAINHTQNISDGTPTKQNNNTWVRNWIISPASQEEIDARLINQWSSIRFFRGQKLKDSDWTQLPDAPLTAEQKSTWAAYRQALRDITTQTDPFNISWPIAP